jgi:uncharacterized membrane protein required for colicin V production
MSFPESFYTIDIIFGFFCCVFALHGFQRGFYRELAGAFAVVLLYYGCFYIYPVLSGWMGAKFTSLAAGAIPVLTLAILVVGSVVVYIVTRLICEKILQARLGLFTDRFSGTVMGIVRGVIVLSVVLATLSLLPSKTLYIWVSQKSVAGNLVTRYMTPIMSRQIRATFSSVGRKGL